MMRDDDTNGKPIKRVFVCTLLRTVWARVCVCRNYCLLSVFVNVRVCVSM